MYNKHLDSFIRVAETGSFSAAANKLFISRAALIQQINLLEQHTGIRLFERHHKGVTLTPAGEQFLIAARSMVYVSANTIARCREIQGRRALRIGMLPNITPHFLPGICRAFSEQHPDIQIQFEEFPLEEYRRSFQERRFDVTMELTPGFLDETPDAERLKIAEDRHCLGIPRKHPYAKKKYVTERDLAGASIIMFPHGTSNADNRLRGHLLKHAQDINIIDNVRYDRSLPIKCEMSSSFLVHYARYPESFLPLVPVPLKLKTDIPIDIGFGYHKNPPEVVQLFLDVAARSAQAS